MKIKTTCSGKAKQVNRCKRRTVTKIAGFRVITKIICPNKKIAAGETNTYLLCISQEAYRTQSRFWDRVVYRCFTEFGKRCILYELP